MMLWQGGSYLSMPVSLVHKALTSFLQRVPSAMARIRGTYDYALRTEGIALPVSA